MAEIGGNSLGEIFVEPSQSIGFWYSSEYLISHQDWKMYTIMEMMGTTLVMTDFQNNLHNNGMAFGQTGNVMKGLKPHFRFSEGRQLYNYNFVRKFQQPKREDN